MTKLLSPWKAHNQFKMEIPTKLWYHEAEYQRWWLLNNKIKKETRLLFRRATKLKTNNKLMNYGIDWKSISDTLKPFPYNIEAYHIDHIIPLNEFNFIHEDESINLTELKKAWCPANLRVIKKERNMSKNRSCSIEAYPLRFEFIFNTINEANYHYMVFRKLGDKNAAENKVFMQNIEW